MKSSLSAKAKILTKLFFQFLKFGAFTYGGGWSIVGQMQKTYVEEQKIMTTEELVDITGVGRSLPGVMITNVAMIFGYKTAGYIGGLICVLGTIIPPLTILLFITYFYEIVKENYWVIAAMSGMRAAVVPIIICAVRVLFKSSFKLKPCYFVAAVCLIMSLLDYSCFAQVIFGGVCGLIMCHFNERHNINEEKKS